MADYVDCPNCRENGRETPVKVLPGYVCLDCWCPTPEERHQRFEELRYQLERSREGLRDEFAKAALIGLLACPHPLLEPVPRLAWQYADAMLAERARRD